jgi:hypothetical protein
MSPLVDVALLGAAYAALHLYGRLVTAKLIKMKLLRQALKVEGE